MLNDEMRLLINEYFDGELTGEKENYLFSVLSTDTEAREYFKEVNQLKTYAASSIEQFPDGLDQKIAEAVRKSSSSSTGFFRNRNLFSYLAYALVILMIFGGYIFIGKYNFQREQLTAASETISKQKELLQLVTTSHDKEVTVNAELENKIIVKANL